MTRRTLGGIFVALGICAVLLSGALIALGFMQDLEARRAIELTTTRITDAILADYTTEDSEDGTTLERATLLEVPSDFAVVEIDGEGFLGILNIPSISLSLPINEEFTQSVLDNTPAHYYGEINGQLVIGAHNYNRHFGEIHRLNHGALVEFIDARGNSHRYTVERIEILCDTDVYGKIRTNYDLTLFTCTPNRVERVVVRAAKVRPAAPPPPETPNNAPSPPNLRIRYDQEVLRLRRNHLYSIDGGFVFTQAQGSASLDVSDHITSGEPIHIKTAATNRRPVSQVQVINPLPRAVLEDAILEPSNGILRLGREYEVLNPSTGRWGSLPRITQSGEFQIRLRQTARTVSGHATGNAASLPGRLLITYGSINQHRQGIVAARVLG